MTGVNEFMIHFEKEFKGIRILDTTLYPTKWKFKADLILNDDISDDGFNFSLLKMRFWFDNMIDEGVFLSAQNEWAISSLVSQITNIPILCPFDPTDDHICMLLKKKLTALSENVLTIGYTELSSDTGQNLSFTFVGDEIYGLPTMDEWIGKRTFFDDPWWDRNDGSTLDVTPKEGADLSMLPEFAVDLDFLLDHSRHKVEESSTKIIRPKFKPKIVK